jgi:alpha-amylase
MTKMLNINNIHEGEQRDFFEQTNRKSDFTPYLVDSSINDVLYKKSSDGCWYNLQGTRINGKPTEKGVYLHNGRKVIVR